MRKKKTGEEDSSNCCERLVEVFLYSGAGKVKVVSFLTASRDFFDRTWTIAAEWK